MKKPVIGMFTYVGGDYIFPIHVGARKAAADLDCHLAVYFCPSSNGELDFTPEWFEHLSPIYEENLEALIFNLPSESIIGVARRLSREGRHVAVVGRNVESVVSFVPHQEKGVADAVLHLAGHGHRKIAFVAGPAGNACSEGRMRGYREGLERNGIPFDPDLVVRGNFWEETSRRRMKELSAKKDFTAVIAANDYSAIGSIQGLRESGRQVPRDVAVIGYDNTMEGRMIDTPLTSIAAPLMELGYQAVKAMVEKLQGRAVREVTLIPSRLVIRESCGCSPQLVSKAAGKTSPALVLAELEQELMHARFMGSSTAGSLAESLVKAIGLPGEFIASFKSILKQAESLHFPMERAQNLISILRGLSPMPEVDECFHQARAMVNEMCIQYYCRQEMLQKSYQHKSIAFRHVIGISDDEKSILQQIRGTLEQLSPAFFGHVLFEKAENSPKDASGVAFLQVDGKEVVSGNDPVRMRRFDPFHFLCNTKESSAVAFFSLFAQKEQMGYMMLDLDSPYVPHFHEFVRLCALLIKGSRLIAESSVNAALKERTRELEITQQLAEARARELELAGLRLKEQTKELERSNRELEQFAYVASHDLQEPLRMIKGYTRLLARKYERYKDPDTDEFIGYVVDGAARMQNLINDLLSYSRVGSQKKAFQQVNCQEVLNVVLENLAVLVRESNARIISDPMPVVLADQQELVQLFQNLIGNAIKYHGQEAPEVHVTITTSGKVWVIGIKDNGIGIDPEHHDRIFQIFQRLHAQEEYSGTGIGLAICKKIVERHGGRIWVESVAGEGSTFCFTLPMNSEACSA